MKKLTLLLVALISYTSHSQHNIRENIDQLFESYACYNRFVGNVLISKNDKIIYQKNFGYADIKKRKKHTDESIFSIASVTKPLTAVAIMQLVDQKKLSLDTTINTFFPNFIPKYSRKITVRHLLNHSSGMQANIGRIDNQGNGLMPNANPISLDELLEKFKDSKLKFAPGKGYEYNNFGYTLLASIIESVTKQSYAEYMQQAVFGAAKMKATSVNNFKNTRKKASALKNLGMTSLKNLDATEIHTSWLKGAGNITSTTADLYKFLTALENGKILKKSSVKKLYSLTQSRGDHNSMYGLGWRIQYKNEEKWINHTGLLPGAASIIGTLPKRNIKIIILSNATTTDLISESNFQGKEQYVDNEITDKLIAILQGENVNLLPLKKIENYNSASSFNKTYQLDKYHSVAFVKKGTTYTLKTLEKAPWSIFTYKFSKSISKKNKATNTATVFAKAMSTQNFTNLVNYTNKQMKQFVGSKKGVNQIKGMWSHFLKNAGSFNSYNLYNVVKIKGVTTVYVRFHFEKEDVGIAVALNTENKIQGMFMDDAMRTNSISQVQLTPISTTEFFINGHQHNGMQDLKVTLTKQGLVITDGNAQYKAAQKTE